MLNKVILNKQSLFKNILATASTLAITLVATDAMTAAVPGKLQIPNALQVLQLSPGKQATPVKKASKPAAEAAGPVTPIKAQLVNYTPNLFNGKQNMLHGMQEDKKELKMEYHLHRLM